MPGDKDARRAAELSNGLSDTIQGFCQSIDWANSLASIVIGGALQVMPWVGPPPWKGQPVRVVYAARKPMCWAVYGASQGAVQSVAANMATVLGDDNKTYIYPASVTVATGNRVRIDHAAQLITAVYPAEPPVSAWKPADPPPASTGGSATFRPVDSGNYRSGVYQNAYVEISTSRSGHYWYGTQIADTIPDSATISRAEINLNENWDNVPGTPSKMGTHTQAYRGGEPALSGAVDVYNGGTIPLGGYADALKTGAAYGIGFALGTGWRQFDTAARSGSIYMEWN